MKPSFAIVGCGRVGTAFAKYLSERGYPVAGVACRTQASAQTLAALVGTSNFSTSPWEITPYADVVFLTTPDGVIEGVCDIISKHNGFKQKAVVLHSSGALPSTILSAAKRSGAFVGSLHPLQSFASKSFQKSPFPGIITDIEGDDPAVEMAAQIASDLGANSLSIKTEAKTLFHASAVVASNYLVAVLDLALRLAGEAGVGRKEAWKVLQPLVNGTLSNIDTVGIPEALTGPISRGDVETVARHLESMKEKTPALVPLYKALGVHTITVAVAKGTLNEAPAQAIEQALS